jgi:glycosyltransferase involved in cell wall biosynthesis
MHVLIVPSEIFITDLQPLSGIFQHHQARALSERGYKVGVLSVGFITPRYLFKEYNYIKYERTNNVSIYRKYEKFFFPLRVLSPIFKSKILENSAEKLIEEYIKKEGMPDLIHAHNFFYAGVIAMKIKKNYGIPFVVTEHSSNYARGNFSESDIRLIKNVATYSSSVSAVSNRFRMLLSEKLSQEIELLHNIVDLSFADDFLDGAEKSDTNFVFLNVASLDNNKNQILLIRAFASAFKGQKVELRIAGDGPLLNFLIEESKKLGVEQQIKFLGRLSRLGIKEQMDSSSFFVLTSNYETFGVVLIEALTRGLPVISSKSGGPEDIVNDDVGYLFDVGDIEGLIQCMIEAKNSRNKYCKKKLNKYVVDKFGINAFVSNASKIYQKAIRCK